MSDYHLDEEQHSQIVKHLRDMEMVLTEIAVTYELLGELLERHATALHAPAVDERRRQLVAAVGQMRQRAAGISQGITAFAAGSERVASRIRSLETEI